eukprot:Skav220244  [mRNA]  locus=scaffold3452:110732:111346:- [translate_table: standard]
MNRPSRGPIWSQDEYRFTNASGRNCFFSPGFTASRGSQTTPVWYGQEPLASALWRLVLLVLMKMASEVGFPMQVKPLGYGISGKLVLIKVMVGGSASSRGSVPRPKWSLPGPYPSTGSGAVLAYKKQKNITPDERRRRDIKNEKEARRKRRRRAERQERRDDGGDGDGPWWWCPKYPQTYLFSVGGSHSLEMKCPINGFWADPW